MRLLPNEEELSILNVNQFVLSNYRVETVIKDWGESSATSIFLEDISSMGTRYTSNIWFIVLGVLCVVVGFFVSVQFGMSLAMIPGLVLAVIFIILWAVSRKRIILIYANGGAPMHIDVSGMPNDKILDLLHQVSVAKQARVNQLHKV